MSILDLSSKKQVVGAKYWSAKVDQLYHPLGNFGQDSQDVVYSRDSITTTKFLSILIKEYFYILKKDGYLIVDYKPNKFCDFQKLEEYMWWLWQGKYDIIYHGTLKTQERKDLNIKKLLDFVKNAPLQPLIPKEANGYFRFVCKKLVSTKVAGDDINHWTFGIITKGERNDWMEEIIQSIHKQKIPHYEIIVCGTYFVRREKNFTYIPFSERDDRGWITRKKNLIARAAKYENLCLIHDRIVLDKDWFAGMKKYGNCFELLTNKQILKGQGIRAGDWLTYGSNTLGLPYSISKLDYEDWDSYIYISGQVTIWKKSIWKMCPWNETRYWGEEDVELTFRCRDLGFIPRFNPHSSSTALTWRFGELPSKYYFSQGLLPKDMLVRRIFRQVNRLLFTNPLLKKIFFPLIGVFAKSRVYKFIISH